MLWLLQHFSKSFEHFESDDQEHAVAASTHIPISSHFPMPVKMGENIAVNVKHIVQVLPHCRKHQGVMPSSHSCQFISLV